MAAADAATFASDLRTVPTLIQKFPSFLAVGRTRLTKKEGEAVFAPVFAASPRRVF